MREFSLESDATSDQDSSPETAIGNNRSATTASKFPARIELNARGRQKIKKKPRELDLDPRKGRDTRDISLYVFTKSGQPICFFPPFLAIQAPRVLTRLLLSIAIAEMTTTSHPLMQFCAKFVPKFSIITSHRGPVAAEIYLKKASFTPV